MKLKYLKNKKIYLSPYNDLSIKLKEKLKSLNIEILGFIDSYKSGENIYKKEQMVEYDYVVVSSGVHWYNISANFDKNKMIISNQELSSFNLYPKYMKSLKTYSNNFYDILFMPHNKAHTLDMIPIIRMLQRTTSYNIAFINIKDRYDNEGAFDEILKSNIPYIPIDVVKLEFVKLKLFICMNDWEQGLANPFVQKFNKINITTIGIVEGITDFTAIDYKKDRDAYQTVQYVLTTGRNDLSYLKNKKTFVVGIPKMLPLWNRKNVYFPQKTLIVINLSFLSLFYNDYGDTWLSNVIQICEELHLNYIISKHPNDVTNVANYNVTNKTIYEILDEGTLLISRFSTVILESIALGKPAVYFKPKPEKTKLYDNNYGAFSIAKSKDELKKSILYELEHKNTVRQRANKFLDEQCNINETVKPELLAAKYIKEIMIQEKQN